MDLKHITQKLNEQFSGEGRKLVFWYDANAEFVNDISQIAMELMNAELYYLEPDAQFQAKYTLERENSDTNYLVYASFPKPSLKDNHLADTIRYSTEFFADKVSLIRMDLGMPEAMKPVLQKYSKFFGNMERVDKFARFDIEQYSKEKIEITIMSVLCKAKNNTFDEVVREVLAESDFEDNIFMAEFEKYELSDAFWNLCSEQYGYDKEPSLQKFVRTLFVTYLGKRIHCDLPEDWKSLVSVKSGNVLLFMENFMNHVLYRDMYVTLALLMEADLQADKVLKKLSLEELVECDTFPCLENQFLNYLTERLEDENVNAVVGGQTIVELCKFRSNTYFGQKRLSEYKMLECAYYIMVNGRYHCPDTIQGMIKQYVNNDYQMDRKYRKFYYYFDQIEECGNYAKLRQLVENIYTNEYLNKQVSKWNYLSGEKDYRNILLQEQFYRHYIGDNKHSKSVVIISDAMRYEVAQNLFTQFERNENCFSTTLEHMIGVLPSVTQMGMAALLPHQQIDVDEKFTVTVDGCACAETKQRDALLKKQGEENAAYVYDDIKSLSYNEMTELFSGKNSTFYIYHNQIDARGDKSATENEVFVACEEAIQEIFKLVIQLARWKCATYFYITADHGFIYKRDKIKEGDKIHTNGTAILSRRYVLGAADISIEGVCNYKMKDFVQNTSSDWTVSTPLATDVFKSHGGCNYVHGGSSIQEMLIPVISVTAKTGQLKRELQIAKLSLVSILTKVTNLIVTLEFIQSEPIGTEITPGTYHIYFADADYQKISNEVVIIADKKEKEAGKRIFREKFRFLNREYEIAGKYYLLMFLGDNMDLPVFKQEVRMDMAFVDDFGF